MKYNFTILLTLPILIILGLLSGCGSDDENPLADVNLFNATINSESSTYSVIESNYSFIRKSFDARLSNGSNLISVSIKANDPEELLTGSVNTNCRLVIELVSPQINAASIFSSTNSSLTIENISRSNTNYTITAKGSELILTDFSDNDYTIEKLDFVLNFEIPSKTDLDFISFNGNDEAYIYYGDNASGYLSPFFVPNPEPEDTELVLTANVADNNPRDFTFEGISIINISPSYPPTVETLTGFQEGVRMQFLAPELGPDCPGSNQVFFSNGNNITEDFNTCSYEITNVTDSGAEYILTGIFSGIITSGSSDNKISITEGQFRISVPKL